eukprot:Hpha_TRINITY_DN35398_c0_g1::TRINITY_DN35398_c0_g1_i1::g.85121::m.85121
MRLWLLCAFAVPSHAAPLHGGKGERAVRRLYNELLRHTGIELNDILDGMRREEGRVAHPQVDAGFNCGGAVGACTGQIFKNQTLAIGVDLEMRACDYSICSCAQKAIGRCVDKCAKEDFECVIKCGRAGTQPKGTYIADVILLDSTGTPQLPSTATCYTNFQ